MSAASLPVVAVIGRPNVGKSTLVNRVLRRRLAVVDPQAGVTRDRRQFEAEWNGRSFILVDTGGWELSPDEPLIARVRGQTEAAAAAADLVVYLADATTQVTDDDQGIARLLLRSGVPHLFVANKVDGERQEAHLDHLWSLGLGEPIPISAQHGRGVGDFLDALVDNLPAEGSVESRSGLARLAIIGRPNVGKSTLLNKLAGEQRVLVDDQPGTTRDPIDMVIDLDGEPFEIVDTAGIRRRTKIDDDADFYAVLRAREAIATADVALLVIDGTGGVTHQEQRLAEEIAAAGVGLIVLLNKWDAVDDDARALTEDGVGDRLAFVSWAPVLRISALTGSRIHRLPKAIRAVLEARRTRVATPQLNRLIRSWQEAHPPPMRAGKRARIIYAVQADTNPP
ncbi:MAG: ribosome biogenesis GTPase Der, partial [Acidimicrobiia bacterium]|nr:ribosome biogenesis GTPase Der [Acidimicrobiia bacterium]